MKIVINGCYGGFSISMECAEYMEKLGCPRAKAELDDFRTDQRHMDEFAKTGKYPDDCKNPERLKLGQKYLSEAKFYGYGYVNGFNGGYERDSEYLVRAVEDLGRKANGQSASLDVVEIPDGVDWEIDEYDGMETIDEVHRSWS